MMSLPGNPFYARWVWTSMPWRRKSRFFSARPFIQSDDTYNLPCGPLKLMLARGGAPLLVYESKVGEESVGNMGESFL